MSTEDRPASLPVREPAPENNFTVVVTGASKYYKLYDSPRDRLKEALHPFKKEYHRKFYALNNIDLEVSRGEILGIIGKNGSGKSTLLKLIAGVLQPSSGTVETCGNVSALLELSAGLNMNATGIDNIYFYGSVLGFSRSEIDRRLDGIISFADIGEFIHQPVKTYSSGMRARLGFSLATSVDPEVLIVDEVLAVGDIRFKRKCYDRMKHLFEQGKTILFVTHAMQSVAQFCTRAVLLHEGAIVMDGKPKEVTTWYNKLMLALEPGKVLREIGTARFRAQEGSDPGLDESTEAVTAAVAPEETEPPHPHRYLPGLKSNSKITRNHDVDIANGRIVDSEGRLVNVLETGKHYTLKYDVSAGEAFESLRYGFSISTAKGLKLTGCLSGSSLRGPVSRGDRFTVACRFENFLLAGDYFVTAGLATERDGSFHPACTVFDMLIFKIDANVREGDIMSGFLTLHQDYFLADDSTDDPAGVEDCVFVFCGGLYRSGSTLQYQIASEIIEGADRGRRLAWKDEKFSAEREALSSSPSLYSYKTHVLTPEVEEEITSRGAKALYIYRDIRDVTVSYMSVHGISFSEVLERRFIETAIQRHHEWTGLKGVHVSRYEEVVGNIADEARDIASYLAISLTPSQCCDIAGKLSLDSQLRRIETVKNAEGFTKVRGQSFDPHSLLHSNHITDPRQGKWVDSLTSEELGIIEKICRQVPALFFPALGQGEI